MARLERFLDNVLATRTNPGQREILHRYAVWHLLRRLRRRNNGQATTHEQYAVVHQHVRAAVVLLDWLAAQHLTLGSCGQADLDRWLSAQRGIPPLPGRTLRPLGSQAAPHRAVLPRHPLAGPGPGAG